MPPEPLIEWPQPFIELLGFAAAYLAAGAPGFHFAALRPLFAAADDEVHALGERMARRAPLLGLLGAVVRAGLFARRLPEAAARRHVTVSALVTGNAQTGLQLGLILLTLAGFALAVSRRSSGWALAALGVCAAAVSAGFFGQWDRIVNPMHVLAGGLWIGTLFMLLVVGLPAVLSQDTDADRRGARVAAMVNGFSPLALVAAAVLAISGVITAWQHLHTLAALWTTPYGYALIAKLCTVMVVAGLGAWNWRRQRPALGSEAAAHSLQKSARTELIAAGVVLLITAILVSLPSPRPPGG